MKRLFIFCIAACFTMAASAQVTVGPKVGVNFSKVNFGDYEDRFDDFESPFHTGLNAGIGADFGISESFSLYTELIWTQKGSEYEGAGVVNDPLVGPINTREETDVSLNYLELPVLFRLKFGDMTKFYINAGPTFAYWLGGEVESEFDGQDFESDIDFEDRSNITGAETGTVLANEDVNRFEVGGAIGAGTLIDMQMGKLNIDFRYGMGLTPFFEDNEGDADQWRNSVLSISLGYFFELGGGMGTGYTRY